MISGVPRVAVVKALILFTCGHGRAAVSLKVQLGFDGIFRLGAAFPVRVEVVNAGPATHGVLEVAEVRGGPTRGMGSYVLTHRRDLFLAAQSRKIVRLTVDPDTVAKPLRVRFRTGDRLVETSVGLRGRFTSQPLILLLTRHNVSPVLPLAYETPIPVVSLDISDLPVDSRAYGGIWSVMIYEQSLRDLSQPQRHALESWLTEGGMLAVLGGLHYALYQEPVTASLLPVRVRGLKEVDGLPQLGTSYGKGRALRERFFVQDAQVIRGSILAEEGNTPIWVEQRRGEGKVAYLALDVGRPPVSEWSGLSDLFSNMLGSPPNDARDPWSVWNRTVFTGLIEEFGLISFGSSVTVFFVGILLYLAALLVWYQFWKGGHQPPSVLTTSLALLVVFFALVGYWYFDRSNLMPDGVLVSSTVVDGDPWSEEGAVHSNVGLFSTRKRDFAFRVNNGWTHLDYVPPAGGAAGSSVFIRDGLRSTVVRIPLTEWDSGLFKVRAVEPFPVRLEWRKLRDRYALHMSNLAETRLTECWLVIGGRAYELGDIPPGGQLTREVAIEEPDSNKGLRLMEIPFKDKAREVLLRKSIFSSEDKAASGQTAFVIGWIQGASPEVQVDDQRVEIHQYKLFRASVPLGGDDDL
jgi:hypothetical protein